MGFIDNKKEIVESVALYQVLGNLPKNKSVSSLESVNSKNKNLLDFLLDLFVVTCKEKKGNNPVFSIPTPFLPSGSTGSRISYDKCDVKKILLDILTTFFPQLVRILKDAIKEGIKAGLMCSTNFRLPNTNARVTMDMKNLDVTGLTKIDPNSQIGSTFYGKDATKDFNRFLSDLTQTGGNRNWKGLINLNYSLPTQKIDIELDSSYLNSGGGSNSGNIPKPPTFDGFLNDYTESLELINKENLMARVNNKMTGVLSRDLGSSLEKFINDEKISKLQDKINNTECGGNEYEFNDSYFSFSDEEVLEIEERANQKYKGQVLLDLGCGIQPVSMNPDTIKNDFDKIRNSTNTTSTGVLVDVIESSNNTMTSDVSPENKENSKKSLNKEMLKEIPKSVAEIVFEPKITVLYHLASKMVNGPVPNSPLPPFGSGVSTSSTEPNIKVENSFDFAKATSVFFEYVVRKSFDALLKIILNKVTEEIIRIVTEQIILIIKEKAKMKAKAIKSTFIPIETPPLPNNLA